MSLLSIFLFTVQALAFPSSLKTLSPSSGSIARRAAPARSAILSAPKLDHLPFWTTTLTVNGEKVTMMIDSGSADFWLHGSKAPPAKGGPGARLVPGESFSIAYGGSSNAQEGNGVTTTVSIGDLSVPDFVVGTVTHDVYKSTLDGIMGLAFTELNSFRPTQQPTLMESVQSQLQQPVFTVNFKPDSTGNLEFGIVDHSKHKGTLIQAEVNNQTNSDWTVDGITLTAGKAKLGQSMSFDTGGGDTMLADGEFVDAYWRQVANYKKMGGNYVFPCSSKLPDMNVSIGSAGAVTIPGSRFKGVGLGSDICVGLLQEGTSGYGRGNIGGPFFLSMFVVFDQATPAIRFAPQA